MKWAWLMVVVMMGCVLGCRQQSQPPIGPPKTVAEEDWSTSLSVAEKDAQKGVDALRRSSIDAYVICSQGTCTFYAAPEKRSEAIRILRDASAKEGFKLQEEASPKPQ